MKQARCHTSAADASLHGPLLDGPSRDLTHRQAALVIALMSCGLWVMLARLAAQLS